MTDDTAPKKRRAATSASYSITMRLHTESDPAVVGRIATAIAPAGGIVTALDVAESRHDRLVVDVTCSATDSEHADEIVGESGTSRASTVHKVSDRTFLLHIGGKIEVRSKVPLRTRDDLSMAYTPGVGRVSLALAEHPEDVPAADREGQQRRRRHRRLGRARARQHRSRCRAAGDGGQVRPVQAVRRHRRVADLPRHPGHRPDRRRRRGDRAGLRRHQPRGHRRAALLRDRGSGCASGSTSRSSTTTSTAPRSSYSPR